MLPCQEDWELIVFALQGHQLESLQQLQHSGGVSTIPHIEHHDNIDFYRSVFNKGFLLQVFGFMI